MKHPRELRHDALAAIVRRLQEEIYLDSHDGRRFWNPAKDWSPVDSLIDLAGVLSHHGLAPSDTISYSCGEAHDDHTC